MLSMNVKMDISAASKMLNIMAEKQLPFAFAYALTLTANDAREEIVRQLPQKFTLRSGWWKPYSYMGFNVRPAKKRWLVAEIYTRADFMQLQEEGGVKHPSGKMIAIPTSNVRTSLTQKITKARRPAVLLRRTTRPGFILPTKSGPVLFRRVTKHQVKALYVLTRQATIRPRLSMQETASQILQQRLYINFDRAFTEAIRTAR
ncbi:MAG: hypothetical protein KKH94_11430 [Candidatus Omnitrophica bacterium]|nr:hypothetical protein [Candidatus Omnitrophota bacterium]